MKGKGGKGAMSEEKHRCEGRIDNYYSVGSRQCVRVAVVCDNGKWHCRQHSAAETEERRAIQDAKWDAKAAKLKEAHRRAECFPSMLAVLKEVQWYRGICPVCYQGPRYGHNPNCLIGLALAQAEKEEA